MSWVDSKSDGTIQTTDADGVASFSGMNPGTYTLVEVKAPDGYTLNDDDTEFTMSGNAVEKTVTITNHPITELPHTGGRGIVLIVVIAGVLALVAGIFGKKKPKDHEDK